ncbi:unnamed protein product [Cutaneotrichosporon oleaginosum]
MHLEDTHSPISENVTQRRYCDCEDELGEVSTDHRTLVRSHLDFEGCEDQSPPPCSPRYPSINLLISSSPPPSIPPSPRTHTLRTRTRTRKRMSTLDEFTLYIRHSHDSALPSYRAPTIQPSNDSAVQRSKRSQQSNDN